MDFPLSRQIAQDLTFVAETGSTNADLVANFANAQDFSVLVAGFQTAGRGRSGRDWLAPAGSSLFVSVLLKPSLVAANRFSWIPLLAGLAMAKTVAQFLPNKKVSLKWPNDVLVESNKVSGVLSELLPDLSGVVVGFMFETGAPLTRKWLVAPASAMARCFGIWIVDRLHIVSSLPK